VPQPARAPFSYRCLIPPAFLLVGLIGCWLGFAGVSAVDDERVRSQLALRVQWRIEDIREKLGEAAAPMQALAIFMSSQRDVGPEEFHSFAHAARGNYPVAHLFWAYPVSQEERAEFEAMQQARGFYGPAIVEPQPGGGFMAALDRALYLPAAYDERFGDAASLHGFDFFSEPVRRETAERARDLGVPLATPPIQAATGRLRSASYTLFWPVYRGSGVPPSLERRRFAFDGFVIGSFRMPELVSFLLAGTADRDSAVSVYLDRQGTAEEGPVVRYDPADSTVALASTVLPPDPAGLRLTSSFEYLGHGWEWAFDYPPAVIAELRSPNRWAYLGFGLLLTLGGSLYLLSEQRRRRVIEETVAERTKALRLATSDLQRMTEQMRGIIEASPHPIVCLDAQQRVLLWNRAADELFGYSQLEMSGRFFHELVPFDMRDEIERRSRRVARGEILRHVESIHRRKDGRRLDTLVSAAAFRDAKGGFEGVILLIEDNTGRKQIQQQLAQAQRMEAIGQLTGGMAHDFNNLLAVLLGNIELIAEDLPVEGEQRRLADAAIATARRGAELIRQLLAFARRQRLAPELIDMTAILESTARLLSPTLGETIRLELQAATDVWPVAIDVSQLESAILNLAVNARDAMPDGGALVIGLRNTVVAPGNPEVAPGEYVMLSFSDTGTGMAPNVVARAFDPFFTTKGNKGSGLGLSMVHGFVKQSGGHTSITSMPGRGTTICIYVPRASRDARRPEQPGEAVLPRGSELVLVAEDNEALRRVAVRQLKSFGYRTFEAADGMQALALLRGSAAIDLLYTDVVMPGLDGRALAEEARQLRPGIKILFTSGFTPGYGSDSGDPDLLTPLLPKPCTKEQLAKAIRAALDDEPSANRGDAALPRAPGAPGASRQGASATNAVPARLS